MEFQSSNGHMSGPEVSEAFQKVAGDLLQLAIDIYNEDAYASHVTHATKLANLADAIAQAELVTQGNITSFTVWQRINTELTGECVALLP